MSRVHVVVSVLFAFVSLSLIAFMLSKTKTNSFKISQELIDGEFYLQHSSEWIKISPDSLAQLDLPEESIQEFSVNLPERMTGGNANMYNKLLKGYFVSYNPTEAYITLRTKLPSHQNIYRDIKVAITDPQTIFCWPQTFQGQSVSSITFDLQRPPVISLPVERELLFSAALDFFDEKSFFFIQLEQYVNPAIINQSIKIAWLCE